MNKTYTTVTTNNTDSTQEPTFEKTKFSDQEKLPIREVR